MTDSFLKCGRCNGPPSCLHQEASYEIVLINYVMSKFASSTGNIPVTGLESYSLEDRCHTDVHIPQEYPTRDFGPTQNWAD